jgi:hypothetical protein
LFVEEDILEAKLKELKARLSEINDLQSSFAAEFSAHTSASFWQSPDWLRLS